MFFVRDLLNELDLSPIEEAIQAKDPRGERPYDPRLMLWILVYGYSIGIYSSRRLERATWEDLSFRVICGDSHPHFTTINEFRRLHRAAFTALFLGVLELCRAAGMVSLGHLALDGTKVKASASKHKAGSYERLTASEKRLLGRIEEMLDQSEALDANEDRQFGKGRGEFELPDDLKRAETRLQRLQEAKARLESEAKRNRATQLRENASGLRERAAETEDHVERRRKLTTAAKAERQADELNVDDEDGPDGPTTALPRHKVKPTRDGAPQPKQQTNFTDPDRQLMKGRDGGFIQAFNAQISVDEDHQIIVGQGVSNLAPDQNYLAPMTHRIVDNVGCAPDVLTADAGYWSEAGADTASKMGGGVLIATAGGRSTESTPQTSIGPPPEELSGRRWMRWKLDMAPNRDIYRRRKSTVEPVFGQIKQARGFRQFSFRGLKPVEAEWSLICLVHNLLKLFRHRRRAMARA